MILSNSNQDRVTLESGLSEYLCADSVDHPQTAIISRNVNKVNNPEQELVELSTVNHASAPTITALSSNQAFNLIEIHPSADSTTNNRDSQYTFQNCSAAYVAQYSSIVADTTSSSIPWINKFKCCLNPDGLFGYVHNVKEAELLLSAFESSTKSKFVITKQSKNFGKTGLDNNHRIYWCEQREGYGIRMTFDGIPYMIVGNKLLECQHGPDRNQAVKRRMQQIRRGNVRNVSSSKRRKLVLETKKIGCKASIYLRDVLKFPNYRIPDKSKALCTNTSKKLHLDIRNGKASFERRIYVSLPKPDSHNHTSTKTKKILDPRIIRQIYHHVSHGVSNTLQMEKLIQEYVQTVLSQEESECDLSNTTDRRFFPQKRDIRNHMYMARLKLSKQKVPPLVKNKEQQLQYIIYNLPPANTSDNMTTSVIQLPASSSTEEFHTNVLPNSLPTTIHLSEDPQLLSGDVKTDVHENTLQITTLTLPSDSSLQFHNKDSQLSLQSDTSVGVQTYPKLDAIHDTDHTEESLIKEGGKSNEKMLKNLSVKCRDLLNHLRHFTYVCKDYDALTFLKERLQDAVNVTKDSIPLECVYKKPYHRKYCPGQFRKKHPKE